MTFFPVEISVASFSPPHLLKVFPGFLLRPLCLGREGFWALIKMSGVSCQSSFQGSDILSVYAANILRHTRSNANQALSAANFADIRTTWTFQSTSVKPSAPHAQLAELSHKFLFTWREMMSTYVLPLAQRSRSCFLASYKSDMWYLHVCQPSWRTQCCNHVVDWFKKK